MEVATQPAGPRGGVQWAAEATEPGLLVPGTIDVSKMPTVRNPDGRFPEAVRVTASDATYPAMAKDGGGLVMAWRELNGDATTIVVIRR